MDSTSGDALFPPDTSLSKYKPKTFFYEKYDIIYHIECEVLINPDSSIHEHNSNVFVFLHQHPDESGTTYKLSCRKLPNIFISQLLNKIFHNIDFSQFPQLEFSEEDKEILKSNLIKELTCYLALDCKPNFSYSSFVEYCNIYDVLSSLE